MAKIQLLTDKQVNHLYESISTILSKKFSETYDKIEKEEVTDKLENELKTNKNVLEFIEKHTKETNEYKAIANKLKELENINENYCIETVVSRPNSWRFNTNIHECKDNLEKWEKDRETDKQEQIKNIAETDLLDKANLTNLYERKGNLTSDIKARLSLTSVTNYETVKEIILDAINIDNYFKPL